jgi:hypothetical protein
MRDDRAWHTPCIDPSVVKIVCVSALAALTCLACEAHIDTMSSAPDGAAPPAVGAAAPSNPAAGDPELRLDVAAGGAARTAPACAASVRLNSGQLALESPALQWLRGFGDDLFTSGLASDAAGNALLARSGAQLLKLDPAGTLLWSKPFGALVATDSSSNVYVAGTFSGALALGASELRAIGGADAYLVKLDPSGAVQYALALGGIEDDEAASLAVATNGDVVVSGPGMGTVKVDSDAHVAWAKSFYGHVALDSVGNAIVAGELTGSVDFGGGALSSAGGSDVFVVKLSPAGEHVFSRRFGDAAEQQRPQALAVDGANDLLVAGVFDGELDFGVGSLSLPAGTCPKEAWCKSAGFVAKLDALGAALWSVSLGPMRSVSDVALGSRDNAIVSGTLPGDVSPFHIPLLFELTSDGAQSWRRAEWPETGIGTGQRLALDACDDVFWSVSALPSLGADERAYLAKLTP